MMAAAFLHAGAVLDRPECNALALKVLSRIWAEAWDDARGIAHVIGRTEPHGLLDDNIQAAAAFLDAYEATGEDAWLTRALAVVRHCVRVHWDETAGGFSDWARDRAGAAYLATPAKPIQDAPTPSANGVAALVLARAAAITDHPEWRRLLDRQLATFAGAAAQLSLYGATLLRAGDWALNPVTRIEVAGPPRGGAGGAPPPPAPPPRPTPPGGGPERAGRRPLLQDREGARGHGWTGVHHQVRDPQERPQARSRNPLHGARRERHRWEPVLHLPLPATPSGRSPHRVRTGHQGHRGREHDC